jgi:hypothetical protein
MIYHVREVQENTDLQFRDVSESSPRIAGKSRKWLRDQLADIECVSGRFSRIPIDFDHAHFVVRIDLLHNSAADFDYHHSHFRILECGSKKIQIFAAINDARIDERRGFGWHTGIYPVWRFASSPTQPIQARAA